MYYLIGAVLLVFFLIILARLFERSNIYFPDRMIVATPSSITLPYEDVYFNSQDGVKLHGWFVPGGNPPRGTIIFCHGNAGNISHRLDIIKRLNKMGMNVFMFDYRGYGKSGSFPSEKGTYLDVLAAYEYLSTRPDVDMDRIVAYGKSLGGALSAYLAAEKDVRVVIIDSTFTSTTDMAKEIYPFLPADLVMTIKYDTLARIGDVKEPKLIIHSEDDEIVPFDHGRRIFESATEPKEFYRIRGGHNDAMFLYEDEYFDRIDEFFKKNGM
ncbi:alpha/beta hydrolase [Candidatus Omnitrophota bacterium]